MIVELTESEIVLAYTVAGQRQGQNRTIGRKARYGLTHDGFGFDVVGALGEIAVAKAFNRFWSGAIGNLKAKDVGNLQVRATDYAQGRLILHPADSDDDRFFLVRVTGNHADIVGWIWGKDGKQQKFWVENDPKWPKLRPAFFVPDSALELIPERIAA